MKAMEMKAELGPGCTKRVGEQVSLLSISFAKIIYRMLSPPFVITGVGERLGTCVEESGHE